MRQLKYLRHSPFFMRRQTSHRRPRGYIRSTELLQSIIPPGSRSIPTIAHVTGRITHNNIQSAKWQKRIDNTEQQLNELLQGYDRYTADLARFATPIYRKKLILERRMFSFLRKHIMLNVLLQLARLDPNPRGSQAAWKRIRPKLREYEKGEARLDLLLRNPRLMKETMEGEINRAKGW